MDLFVRIARKISSAIPRISSRPSRAILLPLDGRRSLAQFMYHSVTSMGAHTRLVHPRRSRRVIPERRLSNISVKDNRSPRAQDAPPIFYSWPAAAKVIVTLKNHSARVPSGYRQHRINHEPNLASRSIFDFIAKDGTCELLITTIITYAHVTSSSVERTDLSSDSGKMT